MNSSLRFVAAITLSVTTILASCSAPAGDAPNVATGLDLATHAPADVAFARNMIPHHQQAIALAAMVPAHTANEDMRVLATHIGADQQAEIRTLDGLLAGWHERSATDMPTAHGAGITMTGMVDQGTMRRLESLYDGTFDTLWVTSMIGHHRGAIAMAQDELTHGENADAIRIARIIITSQQRDIATMTGMVSAPQ